MDHRAVQCRAACRPVQTETLSRPRRSPEKRPACADQAIGTLEHQRLHFASFAARCHVEANLATPAQVSCVAARGGAPDVVSERPFEQHRAVPRETVVRPGRVPEMLVQIIVGHGNRRLAAIPRARVDKQPVLEHQEMRIARVTLRHPELMHRLPTLSIRAAQDQDRRSRMDHVPVRATAKRQVELVSKPHQVGKRVVFSVVKHAAHIRHANRRRLPAPHRPRRHTRTA